MRSYAIAPSNSAVLLMLRAVRLGLLPGSFFAGRESDQPHRLTPDAERSVAGRFAFTAFPATVYATPPGTGRLSISRDADRGAGPTIEVGPEPRTLTAELLESLINNPSWVSNAVGSE